MKRTVINLVSSIMVMVTNIVIGFWLSPYIVSHIGVEANGFITLANNFIMYSSLIVTALNSMAGRFITIEYVKKNFKKANLYYNSVFWGNLIIVAIMLPISIAIIFNLDKLINIPPSIVMDVKILFGFVFMSFFLQTGAPNWECGTFVSNRLDRTYIPNMLISVLRCVFLFSVMTLFTPKVWLVGLSSCLLMICTLIVGRYNTKLLTPELYIVSIKSGFLCSAKAIKELVGAGIWNSISSIGSMLLSGLDLLICNLFIGSTEMGILALAKILPSYMQNFSVSIFNAFAPELVINYAEGDKGKIVHDLNRAMKILSALLSIPLCGLIVMSEDFFSLWVPGQNVKLLSTLTILMCCGYIVTSGTQIMNSVFSTVNKVKINSLLIILSGFVSTVIVVICIKTTNIGLYAVAFVSICVDMIRMQAYTIPMGAKYLGIKCTPFYRHEVLCIIDIIALCGVANLIRYFFLITTWRDFIFVSILIGIVCGIINMFVYLDRNERKIVIKSIKKNLGDKGGC